MLVCIGLASFFSLIFIVLHFPDVDARCPDGYHISPSGDCEIVTHSGGLPRCPDGYHRSPDGDCEQVSSIDDSTDAVEKREPIGGVESALPASSSSKVDLNWPDLSIFPSHYICLIYVN
jgi:hypothetical protein